VCAVCASRMCVWRKDTCGSQMAASISIYMYHSAPGNEILGGPCVCAVCASRMCGWLGRVVALDGCGLGGFDVVYSEGALRGVRQRSGPFF